MAGTLLGGVVGFMGDSTLEGVLYGGFAGFFIEEFYNPIGSHFGVPHDGDINGTSPYLHDLKEEVREKLL